MKKQEASLQKPESVKLREKQSGLVKPKLFYKRSARQAGILLTLTDVLSSGLS